VFRTWAFAAGACRTDERHGLAGLQVLERDALDGAPVKKYSMPSPVLMNPKPLSKSRTMLPLTAITLSLLLSLFPGGGDVQPQLVEPHQQHRPRLGSLDDQERRQRARGLDQSGHHEVPATSRGVMAAERAKVGLEAFDGLLVCRGRRVLMTAWSAI
jgi:hypothetical protein